ncbi:MAG: tRNA (adenosine(37)-N6)-dimethylallyltransferase MiaA [Armatimonadota bacterium]|nr:MAG: tRNA (adenosine(37)-N6)-dimethylallyltransferase MiaA [Armatimonadota bacterium]
MSVTNSSPHRPWHADAATPLVIIVGPTAVGKTAVAVECCLRLGGEVVSADSMQVYRHMDIGTAKPTAEERRGVAHHCIDIAEPDEEYSVARYKRDAECAIADIHARARLPVLCGGTGLYVRAVLYGLDLPIAAADWDLRKRLEDEAARRGAQELHDRLGEVDPAAAARIHPNNVRRVVRALEVYLLTGRPLSSHHRLDHQPSRQYNVVAFGLNVPRSDLYRRIDARVDGMMQRGLLEEARRLLDRGYSESLISMKGLGYRQLAAHLGGETDLDTAVHLIKRDTRHYARRQLTWFRAESLLQWLDVSAAGGAGAAADVICDAQRSTSS